MRLVLASRSPRRLDILRRLGLEPSVDPARVDEEAVPPGAGGPRAYVMRLAAMKAEEVAKRAADTLSAGALAENGGALVLAADTTVALEGEILNKPADAAEARAMLERLSGRAHDVFTGVCLSRAGSQETWLDAARTRVAFRELPAELIERYVASGSPLDKAGAYGVQDHGAEFPLIASLDGDYWNVVGLPVEKIIQGLAHFGEADGLKPLPAPTLEP